MSFELFDTVALRRDLPQHALKAGDTATLLDYVEHPKGGERGCVLEVFNARGDSLMTITVPISDVEAVRADEIFAVRPLAPAS